MKLTLLTLDLLFLFQVKCYGTSDGRNENFEIFYQQGQDAYLENNFQLCVKKMEAALVDYKYYRKVISACKLECQKKVQSQQHVVEHILGRVQEKFVKYNFQSLALITRMCKEITINVGYPNKFPHFTSDFLQNGDIFVTPLRCLDIFV